MTNGWRPWLSIVSGMIIFVLVSFFLPTLHSHARQPEIPVPISKISGEALRLNTLGVAYMNQGKSSDAQKSFEKALAADPNFAQARMNLGISLLAQQKLDEARAALEEAASKLPDDPYAWYNLGLAYKDAGATGESHRGVSARGKNRAG